MKYETYEQYVNHCRNYYKNRDLKVPIEHLIISETAFNTFNGDVNFGPGKESCHDCKCQD